MITLIDTDDIRISVTPEPAETIILCFSGVGRAMGGVGIQGTCR